MVHQTRYWPFYPWVDQAGDDIGHAVRAESIYRQSVVPPAVTLDDSLPGRFIGPFVATIGWVISSVIRAHHADTAFDDLSSLLAAVLWCCLVEKAISGTE